MRRAREVVWNVFYLKARHHLLGHWRICSLISWLCHYVNWQAPHSQSGRPPNGTWPFAPAAQLPGSRELWPLAQPRLPI